MIRKKQLLQNNDLIKVKEGRDNHNAKVTVQYIQNQQIFHKSAITDRDDNIVHTAAHDDLEIENVEYLEENPNMEDYIEDPGDKDEYDDNFYPNAILCLLDLYKIKYKSLSSENNTLKVAQLWRDIAKDMQESFFSFTERQIQQKYVLLREQYFALQTKEDIENFDYFEQLHDIYKDLNKENIAKGLNGAKETSVYFKDEEIFMHPTHLEINEEHTGEFKSKDIIHKEHEFFDMVEKELQAMEDGVHIEDKDTVKNDAYKIDVSQSIVTKRLKNIETPAEAQPAKRVHKDTETCEVPPKTKPKLNEYFEFNDIIQEPFCPSSKTSNDFSLYHYNQEQDRRHREKMCLLEKSIQIQERALERQQQLLQELINRLPS